MHVEPAQRLLISWRINNNHDLACWNMARSMGSEWMRELLLIVFDKRICIAAGSG